MTPKNSPEINQEIRWWWVRHAPSDVPKNRLIGKSDPAARIDEEISPEIRALGENLPSDCFWVTSPLKRAIETSDAIRSGARNLICAEFAEQDFGQWDGLSYDDISENFPTESEQMWRYPATTRPPEGESFEDVYLRVSQAIEVLCARKPAQDIVVIAHAGTIRAALTLALSLSVDSALKFQLDPLSLTSLDAFQLDDGTWSWRVNAVNVPT